MLRHHPSEPSKSKERRWAELPVGAVERTAETSNETAMEAYLRQVESQLAEVPLEVRESVCREMRQHLTEHLAAHRELGTEPEVALQATLQRFGKAESIALRFKHAWTQVEKKSLWVGALPRWIASVALLWLFTLPLALMMSGQQPITRDIPALSPVLSVLTPLCLLVLPVASGFAVGHRSSRRLGQRVFNTALLLTLPVLAVAVITGSLTSGSANLSLGHSALEMWVLGWTLAAVTRHGASKRCSGGTRRST